VFDLLLAKTTEGPSRIAGWSASSEHPVSALSASATSTGTHAPASVHVGVVTCGTAPKTHLKHTAVVSTGHSRRGGALAAGERGGRVAKADWLASVIWQDCKPTQGR